MNNDANGGEHHGGGRPTVAVIGCGPSGMFFLHALATQRQSLVQQKAWDKLAKLPLVTVYERSSTPGGLWSSPSPNEMREETHAPHMYPELWSNGPKEAVEFSDYTFLEHFQGREVPTYLPRSDWLDYLLKRTTRVDPLLFSSCDDVEEKKGNESLEKLYSIRFQTAVRHVSYQDSHFRVESMPTGEPTASSVDLYDYCIWAGGQNGNPRIPRGLLNLLKTGGSHAYDSDDDNPSSPFKGTILHSSHMQHFEPAVAGKRIVLIGDSSSAEDLALNAVRLGVSKVYILSRSGFGDCVYTGSWPGTYNPKTKKLEPKVEVHIALPYRIIDDGTGLKCNEMTWNDEEELYEIDDEMPPITLRNIDTVIFCTGYVPNQDCLHPDLQMVKDLDNDDCFWNVPADFSMRANPFTPELGDIVPSEELDLSGNIMPGVYRVLQIANPNMMYMFDLNAEYPLLELDVAAWLCLAYITGETAVPSKGEMERAVEEQMLEEMHIPYLRWCMDMNYFEALNELGDNHWSDDYSDIRTVEMNKQYARYYTGVLAQDMRTAKYPLDLGTQNALNEKGEQHVQIEMLNLFARHLLNSHSRDAQWRTFRDVDAAPFKSIHTGQSAAPLPTPWIQLDRQWTVQKSLNKSSDTILGNKKKKTPQS